MVCSWRVFSSLSDILSHHLPSHKLPSFAVDCWRYILGQSTVCLP